MEKVVQIPDIDKYQRFAELIQVIQKAIVPHNKNDQFSFERTVIDISKIFIHKTYAKILYALNEIEFSSATELAKPKGIYLGSMYEIDRGLGYLGSYGIISPILETNSRCKAIQRYWSKLYPTSPENPTWYEISPVFKYVVDLYADDFRQKFIWSSQLHKILQRKKTLDVEYQEALKDIHDERLREENKIGNCTVCNKIITNNDGKGSYHSFGDILCCDHCYRNRVETSMVSEWMRKNK